jgi:predicted SAM-dependent methyltransferase
MIKLHLGCGKRNLNGWTHVDVADYQHIDIRTSLDDLSAFSDSTVDRIYCSHALEYFDRLEAERALSEWRRVLIPGGWIYVAVPDFSALTRIFAVSQDLDTILGPLFGRMMLGNSSNFIYHKTVYDDSSLRKLLAKSGFENIEKYDPISFLQNESGSTEFDDHSLAFYPHMDRTGIQVSVCLKGQSPEAG